MKGKGNELILEFEVGRGLGDQEGRLLLDFRRGEEGCWCALSAV
jgi:hypothetical protein